MEPVPNAHEHVCQIMASGEDLVAALRAFLASLGTRDGIFIHRYDEAEAWRLLESAGPARRLQAEGKLTVVTREQAFHGGHPRIHHEHVAQTVQHAVAAAQKRGRGLAILADASHAYIAIGRSAEWLAFESWLGRRLDQDITLVCLYWQDDMERPGILDGMMRTHLSRLSSQSAPVTGST